MYTILKRVVKLIQNAVTALKIFAKSYKNLKRNLMKIEMNNINIEQNKYFHKSPTKSLKNNNFCTKPNTKIKQDKNSETIFHYKTYFTMKFSSFISTHFTVLKFTTPTSHIFTTTVSDLDAATFSLFPQTLILTILAKNFFLRY